MKYFFFILVFLLSSLAAASQEAVGIFFDRSGQDGLYVVEVTNYEIKFSECSEGHINNWSEKILLQSKGEDSFEIHTKFCRYKLFYCNKDGAKDYFKVCEMETFPHIGDKLFYKKNKE